MPTITRSFAAIGALGARSHGLVKRAQLLALGLSCDQVHDLQETGLVRRVEPNVYLLAGHQLDWPARVLSVCLQSGAVASHRSAAALWGLDGFRPGRPEITVPLGQNYRRPGVVTHESTDLHLVPPVVCDQIPATPAARTVLDLGAVVPRRVEQAMFSALDQRLTTWSELLATLVSHSRRGRRGCGPLRALLDVHYGDAADSGLERSFIALLREAGLSPPEQQVDVFDRHGFIMRLDCAYRDLKIAIELDSVAFHANAEAFEMDPVKRNRLKLAGWLLLEFTSRRIRTRPVAVCEEVAEAIRTRSTTVLLPFNHPGGG